MATYGVVHNDADGAGTGWVFLKAIPDIQIIITNYGMTNWHNAIEDADMIYFGDFCPTPQELQMLRDKGKKFLVLDHHMKSEKAVQQYDADNGTDLMKDCVFDMKKAGCLVAWNHFFGDKEPPKLLMHINYADLFDWKTSPDSEIIRKYMWISGNVNPYEMDKVIKEFERWAENEPEAEREALVEGVGAQKQTIKDCQLLAKGATLMEMDGFKFLSFNNTSIPSDIGQFYMPHSPTKTVGIWYYYVDNDGNKMVKWSFRGENAAELASKIFPVTRDSKGDLIKGRAGGGHPQAAGANMNFKDKYEEYPDHITFMDLEDTSEFIKINVYACAPEKKATDYRKIIISRTGGI